MACESCRNSLNECDCEEEVKFEKEIDHLGDSIELAVGRALRINCKNEFKRQLIKDVIELRWAAYVDNKDKFEDYPSVGEEDQDDDFMAKNFIEEAKKDIKKLEDIEETIELLEAYSEILASIALI